MPTAVLRALTLRDFALVTLVMGAGVGLGILGSWLSVRTYLIR